MKHRADFLRAPTVVLVLGMMVVLLEDDLYAATERPEPRTPAMYYLDSERARYLVEKGEFDEAFELLSVLNEEYPDDPEHWLMQATIAERLGLVQDALTAYLRVRELGSKHQENRALDVARMHSALKNRDEALEWLGRAFDEHLVERTLVLNDDIFSWLQDDREFQELFLASPDSIDRDAGWRGDIDYVVREAQRMHAGPDRPAFGDPFLSEAEELKDRIAGLTDTEIFAALAHLMVHLGDGHSYVLPVAPKSHIDVDFRSLPVLFHSFGEGIFIVNSEDPAYLGKRVTQIGALPIDDFIAKISEYTHKDNSQTVRFIGVHFLMRYAIYLQATGVFDDSGVTLVLEDGDGNRETVQLEAGYHDFPRRLRPMPGQESIPLFQSNVDDNYWGTALPDDNIYYFQFNAVEDKEEGPAFEEFARQVVDEAASSSLDNLVLDLRLNHGGSGSRCVAFDRELIRFENLSPKNRLFVIARHDSNSASPMCMAYLEMFTDAIFVGEPASAPPNFVGDESRNFLPYSGVAVSVSERYWQNSQPFDNRPWIAPDIPVVLTFEDFAAGRDRAMEEIRSFIALSDDEDG